jgi:hypothetical protein
MNPEYKSTQQDLTDEKRKVTQECRLRGNQDKVLARIKVLFA